MDFSLHLIGHVCLCPFLPNHAHIQSPLIKPAFSLFVPINVEDNSLEHIQWHLASYQNLPTSFVKINAARVVKN